MNATDELRRLLDERGVECRQAEWIDGTTIKWRGSDGSEYVARNGLSFDGPTGGVVLYDLTPEQAVEATLGRGTCRDTQEDEERFCCSECGSRSHIATEYRKFDEYGNKSEHFLFVDNPRFCPSCGRKVVDA